MKKNSILVLFCIVLVTPVLSRAERAKRPSNNIGSIVNLNQVQSLIKQNRLAEASVALFRMQKSSSLNQTQLKYLLGTTLLELGHYQTAAIQFVDVIRSKDPKYLKLAIDKLSIAADELGDETILNYALKRISENDFPSSRIDSMYYRKGENAALSGNLLEAIDYYSKVKSNSRLYFLAQYQMLIHSLELKKVDQALTIGHRLLNQASNTNDKQVVTLAIARAFYQKQDWDSAIKFYKMIPRDSVYWSDSLFELSWSQLRAARFRSVIGTLQTLHSPFYEDEYMPESLIVRGIVYLYICKFDELDKTLKLFDSLYGRYARKMTNFYKANKNDKKALINELLKADEIRRGVRKQNDIFVPYSIMRSILKEGDIQRSLKYQKRIQQELKTLESDPVISVSPLLPYARRLISKRMAHSQTALAEAVGAHLNARIEDWKELDEQASFLRYELINGKKELLKQKIAGKNLASNEINGDKNRDFYVEGGYEFWPVESEVWLDELGNYHYLGRQECKQ
jgi:tetratricopeptide (TPR) repeat protein